MIVHSPGDMFTVPQDTTMTFGATWKDRGEVVAHGGDVLLAVHVDGGDGLGVMTLLHMKSMRLFKVYNDAHTGLKKIV